MNQLMLQSSAEYAALPPITRISSSLRSLAHMKSVIVLFCLLLGFVTCGYAETYKDIGPLDTLGDLKARFPKATFIKQNPAWAQKTDVMYQISGEGMSGKIIVKLYDGRPLYQEMLEKNPEIDNSEFYRKLVNETDDEAISVEWVRWIPDYIIPASRFISKYGKPDKSGFADEDLQPYRLWEKKGLTAYLTDDEKNVVRVDFQFTRNEHRAAYLRKYKFVPPWLKNDQPTKKGNK
ncbi:MAG TPA: hypothetical protein DFK12_01180 [Gallionellaceae bacterium]|nr:hypothetical protein [Gallionellaceae bacterium]